jgi:hypothetical protein
VNVLGPGLALLRPSRALSIAAPGGLEITVRCNGRGMLVVALSAILVSGMLWRQLHTSANFNLRWRLGSNRAGEPTDQPERLEV